MDNVFHFSSSKYSFIVNLLTITLTSFSFFDVEIDPKTICLVLENRKNFNNETPLTEFNGGLTILLINEVLRDCSNQLSTESRHLRKN